LLAHIGDVSEMQKETITVLARETLAYHISDEETKKNIIELFQLLADNIEKNVSDVTRRIIFGKTMYGVRDSILIESWVNENIDKIEGCTTNKDLLEILWPVLSENIHNVTFKKCSPDTIPKSIAFNWIKGHPFHELNNILTAANAKIGNRYPTIEHVIDICENALSYEGTLVIAAIIEFCKLLRPGNENIIDNLQMLQKQLKYGLASSSAIGLYELGFADQVIALDLSTVIGDVSSRRDVLNEIRQHKDEFSEMINKYPTYFSELLNNLLQS
jgi:hypothetical protein